MKPLPRKESKEIRQRPTMKMGMPLPTSLPGYPFRGENKFASVSTRFTKGGIGVFMKVRF